MSNYRIKIIEATKWSAITEIIAKLIQPVTNMILARLLAPDDFGIVATVTIIFSFAEIFSDAGFQKYIIQHEYRNEIEQKKSYCVAFWSNLTLSIIILIAVIVFQGQLAGLLGDKSLALPIVISCLSLPINAFSSIQFAIFKRNLEFKQLFNVRLLAVSSPLFVTVPIAYFTHSFWALIIGTIASNIINAVMLTYKSNWKPKLHYDFALLKKMFGFSSWTLAESLSIWLTGYGEIFILGSMVGSHYLGVYRVATSTVGQILALIIAATTPVLFSALSRLQNDREQFEITFFKFQKYVGCLIIPMGFGIYIFRDLVRKILLGSQWSEATFLIGLWGLSSVIVVLFSFYCSEVYRSLGKPKLSVLVQVLHIVVLFPTVYYFAKYYDFETLCVARTVIRMQLVLVNIIVMRIVVKISLLKMVSNIYREFIAAIIMAIVGWLFLQYNTAYWFQFIAIIVCILVYFAVLFIFKKEREEVISLLKSNSNLFH